VRVEDHPLEHGSFDGVRANDAHGAGATSVWGTGTYEATTWTELEVKCHLHAARIDARVVPADTRW
jgi:bifunctional non-homologous end joining protein LigD